MYPKSKFNPCHHKFQLDAITSLYTEHNLLNPPGLALEMALLNYLDNVDIDWSKVNLFGCDGTAANTGHKVILHKFI